MAETGIFALGFGHGAFHHYWPSSGVVELLVLLESGCSGVLRRIAKVTDIPGKCNLKVKPCDRHFGNIAIKLTTEIPRMQGRNWLVLIVKHRAPLRWVWGVLYGNFGKFWTQKVRTVL